MRIGFSNGIKTSSGFYLGLIILFLDQFSKIVAKHLGLSSTLIENSRLPFGINLPGSFNFLVLVLAFLIFVSVYIFETSLREASFGFWLIVGGAVSNLLDRALDGKVTDFINLRIAILNFADFAIMGGILWLILNPKHQEPNPK